MLKFNGQRQAVVAVLIFLSRVYFEIYKVFYHLYVAFLGGYVDWS